jgi:hypothetical protein
VLQTDKDFVEIASGQGFESIKFTKMFSGLHMIVILIVYTVKKRGGSANENKAQRRLLLLVL